MYSKSHEGRIRFHKALFCAFLGRDGIGTPGNIESKWSHSGRAERLFCVNQVRSQLLNFPCPASARLFSRDSAAECSSSMAGMADMRMAANSCWSTSVSMQILTRVWSLGGWISRLAPGIVWFKRGNRNGTGAHFGAPGTRVLGLVAKETHKENTIYTPSCTTYCNSPTKTKGIPKQASKGPSLFVKGGAFLPYRAAQHNPFASICFRDQVPGLLRQPFLQTTWTCAKPFGRGFATLLAAADTKEKYAHQRNQNFPAQSHCKSLFGL